MGWCVKCKREEKLEIISPTINKEDVLQNKKRGYISNQVMIYTCHLNLKMFSIV